MKEIFYDTEYEDESVVRNKSTRNFERKGREVLLIFMKLK